MERKKAIDLYNELRKQLNKTYKIKMEISERYEFLLKKYGDKIIPSPNCMFSNRYIDDEDIYFNRIQYIDKVEKYMEKENKCVQLSLFNQ